MYAEGEKLLRDFPVQATLEFAVDSDSESDDDDDDEYNEEKAMDKHRQKRLGNDVTRSLFSN